MSLAVPALTTPAAGRAGPSRAAAAVPARSGGGAGAAPARGRTRGCAGAERRGGRGAMGKSRARRFRRAPFSPAGPEQRRGGEGSPEEEPAAELLEKVRGQAGAAASRATGRGRAGSARPPVGSGAAPARRGLCPPLRVG